jgi:hypothetical protein
MARLGRPFKAISLYVLFPGLKPWVWSLDIFKG